MAAELREALKPSPARQWAQDGPLAQALREARAEALGHKRRVLPWKAKLETMVVGQKRPRPDVALMGSHDALVGSAPPTFAVPPPGAQFATLGRDVLQYRFEDWDGGKAVGGIVGGWIDQKS